MTWMLTCTGAAVNLRLMEPESISMLDIAHHLARIERFGGACSRPYSVAEHSILVLDIFADANPLARATTRLAALLHDAHEAYTGDVMTPLKDVIGEAWRMEERRIERAVQHRFGVFEAAHAWRGAIKHADLTALSTERSQLLPACGPAWEVLQTHPPINWIKLADQARFGWEDWRDAFLDRVAELTFEAKLDAAP